MSQLLTALDIGSNTVLLLTAAAGADGVLRERRELCRTTRLGEHIDRTGRISAGAMQRTLDAVRELLDVARGDAAPGVGIAAATSAVRDARNRDAVLEQFGRLVGNCPEVLSGQEEARTVFLGAASDRASDELVVSIDIGGGSTEISAGYPGNCLFSSSVGVGCVRFAERYGPCDAAAATDVREARRAAAAQLEPVRRRVSRLTEKAPHTVAVVSGGTATTLAAMCQKLSDYDRRAVHGYDSTEDAVSALLSRLVGMTSADRGRLPGVPPDRADILPAGLLVLSEALRQLELPRFAVTTRGLRFGLLLRLQAGELAPTWQW